MTDQRWNIEFFRDDDGSEPCRQWMERDLSTVQRAALAQASSRVLARMSPKTTSGSTFDDYLRESPQLNTEESLRLQRVFGQGYSVAAQLMALRLKRKMTQAQLATLTGIAQSEISRIERGSVRPTDATLIRIADGLDADVRIVERTPKLKTARSSPRVDRVVAKVG